MKFAMLCCLPAPYRGKGATNTHIIYTVNDLGFSFPEAGFTRYSTKLWKLTKEGLQTSGIPARAASSWALLDPIRDQTLLYRVVNPRQFYITLLHHMRRLGEEPTYVALPICFPMIGIPSWVYDALEQVAPNEKLSRRTLIKTIKSFAAAKENTWLDRAVKELRKHTEQGDLAAIFALKKFAEATPSMRRIIDSLIASIE
jgi:hypothetical protein